MRCSFSLRCAVSGLCAPCISQLSSVRSFVGFTALSRLALSPPVEYAGSTLAVASHPLVERILAVPARSGSTNRGLVHRTLELRKQNLFECTEALNADILICETNIDVVSQ
jgi:hypothetical protein